MMEQEQDASDKPREHSDDEANSEWECNVCFESLRIEEACVTTCGHLYCWPCLHKWLLTFRDKTTPPVCPVCKNVISEEKIIPIYGKGGKKDSDRRGRMDDDEVPQRPGPAPREEAPQRQGPFGGFDGFPGVQGNLWGMNFSAGFFGPGVVFGNFGGPLAPDPLTPEQRRQQQFLSQVMLFLGCAVLATLLLT